MVQHVKEHIHTTHVDTSFVGIKMPGPWDWQGSYYPIAIGQQGLDWPGLVPDRFSQGLLEDPVLVLLLSWTNPELSLSIVIVDVESPLKVVGCSVLLVVCNWFQQSHEYRMHQ